MKRSWRSWEEKILIDNYNTKTIKEISDLLATSAPGPYKHRTADAINAEIKRLKKSKKITGYKEEDVIERAYQQR